MYLLQVWFDMSDEGVEARIYDSNAMRRFTRLDFALKQVPDASTLLHFRHLLEGTRSGSGRFAAPNEIFEQQGRIMRGGSIIAVSPSTKNAAGSRDPRMHQTRRAISGTSNEGLHRLRRGPDMPTRCPRPRGLTPAG
jgi:transposase, IS5 family